MIKYSTARRRILYQCRRSPSISVSISEALGSVLAEPITARSPIPRFSSSSVDGFAVRSREVAAATGAKPIRLRLKGTVQAGDSVRQLLRSHSAMKIFTGAPLPAGSTAVVMLEDVTIERGDILVYRRMRHGQNIRYAGKEFAKGGTIFQRGIVITPAVLGMIATAGYERVKVYKKPDVAVIVTGNEVRQPGQRLRRGQIYDSNSATIASSLRMFGVQPVSVRYATDDPASVKKTFRSAFRRADVVISVGGISVGDFDVVKDALIQLGVKTHFWKVAMKPGKPNYFGTLNGCLVFGLPGNPVSALVSFELLVKPAIRKIMGYRDDERIFSATLQQTISKKGKRLEFIRGVATWRPKGRLVVRPTKGQDSHMLSGIANANCLILVPGERTIVRKGSEIQIHLLS